LGCAAVVEVVEQWLPEVVVVGGGGDTTAKVG